MLWVKLRNDVCFGVAHEGACLCHADAYNKLTWYPMHGRVDMSPAGGQTPACGVGG